MCGCCVGFCGISIHALHEESDRRQNQALLCASISIHALHEESDTKVLFLSNAVQISIHALHEESDLPNESVCDALVAFQSTLSMRRATDSHLPVRVTELISIHALHEESDLPPPLSP